MKKIIKCFLSLLIGVIVAPHELPHELCVCVNGLPGPRLSVNMPGNSTVGELKTSIAKELQLAENVSQQIVFKAKTLAEDVVLQSLVEEGDTTLKVSLILEEKPIEEFVLQTLKLIGNQLWQDGFSITANIKKPKPYSNLTGQPIHTLDNIEDIHALLIKDEINPVEGSYPSLVVCIGCLDSTKYAQRKTEIMNVLFTGLPQIAQVLRITTTTDETNDIPYSIELGNGLLSNFVDPFHCLHTSDHKSLV